eukprot:TRINITY_DN109182_c0_g1_i1.p1 TRINITY_DN109182_c0_g1~~TRINITY_DN109182_c0_g1_i1.p1  ORF type:complete len:304 (-),score=29.46 TRINITY_DN109182_c0_g1_i1:86-997(-)
MPVRERGLALTEFSNFQATFVVRNLHGGGAGNFTIQVHPEWAPLGAARFAELMKVHFFNEARFFRVISGFMAQFGIPADPDVAGHWRAQRIADDPVVVSNRRGRVTFAMAGPDTRTTQLFINFKTNKALDKQGFAPFAEVVKGMDIVDQIYSGYGECEPNGYGPSQMLLQKQGNHYLTSFPYLTYIETVEVGNISTSEFERLVESNAPFLGLGPFQRMFLIIFIVAIILALFILWIVGYGCWNPKRNVGAAEQPSSELSSHGKFKSIPEADEEELVNMIASDKPQTVGRKRGVSPGAGRNFQV